MIQPKNETEVLLLSITINCETLINQTQKKADETLEFRTNMSRETFSSKPPIPNEGSWMVGITSLEVYDSFFNITDDNSKLKFYLFAESKIGGISYEKFRDEIEKYSGISDITPIGSQDDIIGPIIIEEYRGEISKRMEDGGYMNNLAGYTISIFQEFESYIRTEIDLVEDAIRSVLDNYCSSFITYEILPGAYAFKDLSENLFNILQLEYPGFNKIIDIEFDDNTVKSKLVVRPGIIAIRFDAKSFFSTILGLKPQ